MEIDQIGFTLIELFVITGIMVFLATAVTLNFRELRSSQELMAAANDLISKVRETQNAALAGRINPQGGAAASSYDIVLAAGQQRYTLDYIFRDPSSPSGTSTTTRAETVILPRTVRLSRLLVDGGAQGQIRIRIESPFGKISVGGQAQKVVQVELTSQAGSQTRTVVIDGVSGRIGTQ